jgi:hypothetical protein
MAASPLDGGRDSRSLGLGVSTLRSWPARSWVVAAVAAVGAGLIIGVPTGIVQTSFYTRMTPVTWWDYPVWGVSAVLVGLTVATYVRAPGHEERGMPVRSRRTAAATVLSTFAVGCPICNKLVVGLIGVSGALSYWAALQPLLGLLSITLLATGLVVRLRGAVACPVPVTR